MPSQQQRALLKPVHCLVPVAPYYQPAYQAYFAHHGCTVSMQERTCSITFPEGTHRQCILDDVPQTIWTLPDGVQIKEIPANDADLSYVYVV